MNDKEILEEVYRRLEVNWESPKWDLKNMRAIRSFIEQEWQKADDDCEN